MSDEEKTETKLPEVIKNARGKPRKSDWGRPKVTFTNDDLKYIYRMARQGLPMVIIAGIVGCSLRTLQRRMAEDPELFALIHRGKSEAYDELYKVAVGLAKGGNERFLLYLMEKVEQQADLAQNHSTVEVGDDKNVTKSIDKKRLLAALEKDKFINIEGSEGAIETDTGDSTDKPD